MNAAATSLELFEAIKAELPAGEVRIGYDDANLSVRQHARLRELLPERVELVKAGGLVERLRAVKEPEEIERIRAAASRRRRSLGRAARIGSGPAQRA